MGLTNAQFRDLYDEAIEKLVTGGNQAYSVNGTQFTKNDLETLERLRDKYAKRVTADLHSNRAAVDVRTEEHFRQQGR